MFLERAIPVLIVALLTAGGIWVYRALRRGSERMATCIQQLFDAVERNDPDEVRRLVTEVVHPDVFREDDPYGDTPLLLAVRLEHFEIASVLVLHGAFVDWSTYEKIEKHRDEERRRRGIALNALAERMEDPVVLAIRISRSTHRAVG